MFNNFLKPLRKAGLLSLLMILVILTSSCSLLPREEKPLKPPLAKPAEMKINATEVTRETITISIRGSGSLEPTSLAYHEFTEPGLRLDEVLVKSGDEVKKGDVLIRLQMKDLKLILLEQRIQVERKQLAFNEVKASGDRSKLNVAMMDLQLEEMKLEKILAQEEELYLKAKMDGVITFVENLHPNDIVDAYQTMVTIADPSILRLSYNVTSASNVNEVELGMDVQIEYEDELYVGKVVQIPRSAPFVEDERLRDRYSRTLYIDVLDLPSDAAMGDRLNVEIVTAEKRDVLTIPKNALRKYFSRSYVQVLEGQKRREIDVEVGLEGSTKVEIVKGLTEGQLVIVQ